MSYYLIFFFLSWAKCLLTSVCFTVYFPWLQTVASLLMHANSVTNLVNFFVPSKYTHNLSLGGQPLQGLSPSHVISSPLQLPPWRLSPPQEQLPFQAAKVFLDPSNALGIRLCPCLAPFYWVTVYPLLLRKMLSLHQLIDTPRHFHLPAFTHVPGVWSFEPWSSMCPSR